MLPQGRVGVDRQRVGARRAAGGARRERMGDIPGVDRGAGRQVLSQQVEVKALDRQGGCITIIVDVEHLGAGALDKPGEALERARGVGQIDGAEKESVVGIEPKARQRQRAALERPSEKDRGLGHGLRRIVSVNLTDECDKGDVRGNGCQACA
ncbi:MAG: hypothetical protein IH899_07650, partial [Planctomycetes bacterium]|nr:hypothetical protein [Planctomycetota bacterium]